MFQDELDLAVRLVQYVLRCELGLPSQLAAILRCKSASFVMSAKLLNSSPGQGVIYIETYFPPRCTETNSGGHPNADPICSRALVFAPSTELSRITFRFASPNAMAA